jgi:hypothetical protein
MQWSRRTKLQLGLVLGVEASTRHHDDNVIPHQNIRDVTILRSHCGNQIVVRDHRKLYKLNTSSLVVTINTVRFGLGTSSVTKRIDAHATKLGYHATNRAGKPDLRKGLFIAHRVITIRQLVMPIHDLREVRKVNTWLHQAKQVLALAPCVVF